jgi:hypothetical protein
MGRAFININAFFMMYITLAFFFILRQAAMDVGFVYRGKKA